MYGEPDRAEYDINVSSDGYLFNWDPKDVADDDKEDIVQGGDLVPELDGLAIEVTDDVLVYMGWMAKGRI
jgi:hypothetical protein